jgi:hypothetical protein
MQSPMDVCNPSTLMLFSPQQRTKRQGNCFRNSTKLKNLQLQNDQTSERAHKSPCTTSTHPKNSSYDQHAHTLALHANDAMQNQVQQKAAHALLAVAAAFCRASNSGRLPVYTPSMVLPVTPGTRPAPRSVADQSRGGGGLAASTCIGECMHLESSGQSEQGCLIE